MKRLAINIDGVDINNDFQWEDLRLQHRLNRVKKKREAKVIRKQHMHQMMTPRAEPQQSLKDSFNRISCLNVFPDSLLLIPPQRNLQQQKVTHHETSLLSFELLPYEEAETKKDATGCLLWSLNPLSLPVTSVTPTSSTTYTAAPAATVVASALSVNNNNVFDKSNGIPPDSEIPSGATMSSVATARMNLLGDLIQGKELISEGESSTRDSFDEDSVPSCDATESNYDSAIIEEGEQLLMMGKSFLTGTPSFHPSMGTVKMSVNNERVVSPDAEAEKKCSFNATDDLTNANVTENAISLGATSRKASGVVLNDDVHPQVVAHVTTDFAELTPPIIQITNENDGIKGDINMKEVGEVFLVPVLVAQELDKHDENEASLSSTASLTSRQQVVQQKVRTRQRKLKRQGRMRRKCLKEAMQMLKSGERPTEATPSNVVNLYNELTIHIPRSNSVIPGSVNPMPMYYNEDNTPPKSALRKYSASDDTTSADRNNSLITRERATTGVDKNKSNGFISLPSPMHQSDSLPFDITQQDAATTGENNYTTAGEVVDAVNNETKRPDSKIHPNKEAKTLSTALRPLPISRTVSHLFTDISLKKHSMKLNSSFAPMRQISAQREDERSDDYSSDEEYNDEEAEDVEPEPAKVDVLKTAADLTIEERNAHQHRMRTVFGSALLESQGLAAPMPHSPELPPLPVYIGEKRIIAETQASFVDAENALVNNTSPLFHIFQPLSGATANKNSVVENTSICCSNFGDYGLRELYSSVLSNTIVSQQQCSAARTINPREFNVCCGFLLRGLPIPDALSNHIAYIGIEARKLFARAAKKEIAKMLHTQRLYHEKQQKLMRHTKMRSSSASIETKRVSLPLSDPGSGKHSIAANTQPTTPIPQGFLTGRRGHGADKPLSPFSVRIKLTNYSVVRGVDIVEYVLKQLFWGAEAVSGTTPGMKGIGVGGVTPTPKTTMYDVRWMLPGGEEELKNLIKNSVIMLQEQQLKDFQVKAAAVGVVDGNDSFDSNGNKFEATSSATHNQLPPLSMTPAEVETQYRAAAERFIEDRHREVLQAYYRLAFSPVPRHYLLFLQDEYTGEEDSPILLDSVVAHGFNSLLLKPTPIAQRFLFPRFMRLFFATSSQTSFLKYTKLPLEKYRDAEKEAKEMKEVNDVCADFADALAHAVHNKAIHGDELHYNEQEGFAHSVSSTKGDSRSILTSPGESTDATSRNLAVLLPQPPNVIENSTKVIQRDGGGSMTTSKLSGVTPEQVPQLVRNKYGINDFFSNTVAFVFEHLSNKDFIGHHPFSPAAEVLIPQYVPYMPAPPSESIIKKESAAASTLLSADSFIIDFKVATMQIVSLPADFLLLAAVILQDNYTNSSTHVIGNKLLHSQIHSSSYNNNNNNASIVPGMTRAHDSPTITMLPSEIKFVSIGEEVTEETTSFNNTNEHLLSSTSIDTSLITSVPALWSCYEGNNTIGSLLQNSLAPSVNYINPRLHRSRRVTAPQLHYPYYTLLYNNIVSVQQQQYQRIGQSDDALDTARVRSTTPVSCSAAAEQNNLVSRVLPTSSCYQGQPLSPQSSNFTSLNIGTIQYLGSTNAMMATAAASQSAFHATVKHFFSEQDLTSLASNDDRHLISTPSELTAYNGASDDDGHIGQSRISREFIATSTSSNAISSLTSDNNKNVIRQPNPTGTFLLFPRTGQCNNNNNCYSSSGVIENPTIIIDVIGNNTFRRNGGDNKNIKNEYTGGATTNVYTRTSSIGHKSSELVSGETCGTSPAGVGTTVDIALRPNKTQTALSTHYTHTHHNMSSNIGLLAQAYGLKEEHLWGLVMTAVAAANTAVTSSPSDTSVSTNTSFMQNPYGQLPMPSSGNNFGMDKTTRSPTMSMKSTSYTTIPQRASDFGTMLLRRKISSAVTTEVSLNPLSLLLAFQAASQLVQQQIARNAIGSGQFTSSGPTAGYQQHVASVLQTSIPNFTNENVQRDDSPKGGAFDLLCEGTNVSQVAGSSFMQNNVNTTFTTTLSNSTGIGNSSVTAAARSANLPCNANLTAFQTLVVGTPMPTVTTLITMISPGFPAPARTAAAVAAAGANYGNNHVSSGHPTSGSMPYNNSKEMLSSFAVSRTSVSHPTGKVRIIHDEIVPKDDVVMYLEIRVKLPPHVAHFYNSGAKGEEGYESPRRSLCAPKSDGVVAIRRGIVFPAEITADVMESYICSEVGLTIDPWKAAGVLKHNSTDPPPPLPYIFFVRYGPLLELTIDDRFDFFGSAGSVIGATSIFSPPPVPPVAVPPRENSEFSGLSKHFAEGRQLSTNLVSSGQQQLADHKAYKQTLVGNAIASHLVHLNQVHQTHLELTKNMVSFSPFGHCQGNNVPLIRDRTALSLRTLGVDTIVLDLTVISESAMSFANALPFFNQVKVSSSFKGIISPKKGMMGATSGSSTNLEVLAANEQRNDSLCSSSYNLTLGRHPPSQHRRPESELETWMVEQVRFTPLAVYPYADNSVTYDANSMLETEVADVRFSSDANPPNPPVMYNSCWMDNTTTMMNELSRIKTLGGSLGLSDVLGEVTDNVVNNVNNFINRYYFHPAATQDASGQGIRMTGATDRTAMVYTRLDEDEARAYQHFDVFKINKYGSRQNRIIGIDGERIYNMRPSNEVGRTKNPERNVADIDAIRTFPDRPLCLEIDYRKEVRVDTDCIECRSVADCLLMVEKLKVLKRLNERKSGDAAAAARRITSTVAAIVPSASSLSLSKSDRAESGNDGIKGKVFKVFGKLGFGKDKK